MSEIVLLSDARLIKERKAGELAFYQSQLELLSVNRQVIEAQINLTCRIIMMIEKELL